MKFRLRNAALIVLFAASPMTAFADVSDALKAMETGTPTEKAIVRSLFQGSEAGLAAANYELVNSLKQPALYCAPERLEFTGDQLVSILKRWIAANGSRADDIRRAPLSHALLYALRDTFPCGR